jgi:hypothetical protein
MPDTKEIRRLLNAALDEGAKVAVASPLRHFRAMTLHVESALAVAEEED